MTLIFTEQDTYWMQTALAQAQAAQEAGEVPVGAVVVCDGQVIGCGRNASIQAHDPSAHAEIMALRDAARQLGNYRLDGCTLYVTLEPCAMCAGAMLHARLSRVVFGAHDPKTGAAGSVLNLFALPQLNHQTQVQGGIMANACAELLKNFFKRQRTQQQLAHDQAGRALREDALRTPESRFSALPGWPLPSFFVNDLPSLAGLRLHYLDAGLQDAAKTLLCLHGPNDWSYAWRELAAPAVTQGHRVICPDLIGFGLSDKPKKAAAYPLAWHAKVVLELMERLAMKQITLQAPESMADLTNLLLTGAPERIIKMVFAEPMPLSANALAAPFPDAGHRAARQAFAAMTMQHEPKIFVPFELKPASP